MAIDYEKLKKIKEAIEASRELDEDEEDFMQVAEKKEEAKVISTIIEKIKEKQPAEMEQLPTATIQDKPLNFKNNVNLDPQPGSLDAIGRFYTSFSGQVNSVAGTMSQLPMAKNLQNKLDAAGINASSETYLAIGASLALIIGLVLLLGIGAAGIVMANSLLGVLAPIIGLIAFVIVIVLVLSYPNMRAEGRADEINRSLPFALRQLSSNVKAGVSFHKALHSIAASNYGILSKEFERTIVELNSGAPTETALNNLSNRTKSKGLKRALTQVNRSFKSGGNLSQILSDIADDVAFEARMEIRDFTEKLNFINVIYIMISTVAPVILAIVAAIMQIPMFGGTIPAFFIPLAFGGIIMVMTMMLFIIHKMEPAAW